MHVPARGRAATIVSFNAGWLFGPASAGSDQPGFDDSRFAEVTLPHTVTPLSWRNWDPAAWERVWTYRKRFDAPPGLDGLRVFLDFGAAMTRSTVTLNGIRVGTSMGGYLPFSVDITGRLQAQDNVLAVTLDSTFNLNVPPNRPAPHVSSDVDFWQPGGIYRDVRLRAVPRIFLADVFAKPASVLDAANRRVEVQATVDAAIVPGGIDPGGIDPGGAATLTAELVHADGTGTIAAATVPVTITAAGRIAVTATIRDLPDITLWDTGNPELYTVIATLAVDGTPLHDYQARIGFREAVFQLDGFYLNGARTSLFGLNRHQFFPFAGGAMPDRVQARDAIILREELNCTMVRCSHYPQSEAFYDACDELGLMVWEEAPGWGYIGDDAWRDLALGSIESMIVARRNHPSIIVWGVRLNECPNDTAFWASANELAHSLDDSRPTTGAMAGLRSTTDYQQDVFAENDYSSTTNAAGGKVPALEPPVAGSGKPYLVSEAVGTLSGPARAYRRTDTQPVQQGQAVAHATVHNIAASDARYCGLLAWAAFDYPSGSGNQFDGVKHVGVADLFRIAKPAAAVYAAQVSPATTPVIAPAFYWDFGPASPVTALGPAMIASNLDELRLYVGGELFATVTPDTADYGNLPYPPSFADFSSVDGAALPGLRIDGYLNGALAASRSFDADPADDLLSLTADDIMIDADGSDATRVSFRATDRYGNARPYVGGLVTLELDGPAALIGDNPLDFGATGGTGAAWIRSLPGSPGTVTVRASHPTLGTTQTTIEVREINPSPGAPLRNRTVDLLLTMETLCRLS